MNEIQKKQLDILIELDKICKENNLTYFLAYGTALGAVRHKGYIPWDDDADVFMFRNDYDRLCNIAKKVFPKNIFLQNVFSDHEYPYMFAKLRDENTTYIENNCKHLSMSHGVFIDIFPLDFVSDNRIKRFLQNFYASLFWGLQGKFRAVSKKGKIISKILNFGLSESGYIKRLSFFDKRIVKYGIGGKKMTIYGYGGFNIYTKVYFPLEEFDNHKIEFEGHLFNINKSYDKTLKRMYGDYMTPPPEEERHNTHPYHVLDLNKSYKEYINK